MGDPHLSAPVSARPRWAVVTGGAQGIGRAITESLLNNGWQVVVVDQDKEALAELPSTTLTLEGDVSEPDTVSQLTALMSQATPHLDLLVNNAGQMGPRISIRIADLSQFDRILAVNLRAPYVLTAALLPWLEQGTAPVIINMASTRAVMSEADTEAYSASKGGLVALTHALAVSLGPRIRVNAISPGWIATEGWQKASRRQDPALKPGDHAQHPAGRVGTPEDVARAVLFLTDPANTFITGVNLVLDGGMTRKMIYLE